MNTREERRGVTGQPLDLTSGVNLVVAPIGLGVLFELVYVVHIVRGQSCRTFDPRLGYVAQPVEPMKPRAVGEMETRDRIGRLAVALHLQQIERAEWQQVSLRCGGDRRVGRGRGTSVR